MKRFVVVALLSVLCLYIFAQNTDFDRQKSSGHTSLSADQDTAAADSGGYCTIPYYYMGGYSWNGCYWPLFSLHEGLNARISMSATVGLGGHHPSGVGFGRDINLVYAPLSGKQLNYAVTAGTSVFNWGGIHYNQAGIGGLLNYAASDKLSFSLEGYKDLIHPKPFLSYDPMRRDSYIGGTVNLKFFDNIFIQVSVGTSTWR